ncbi:MAG TPA: RND family transporter, partial [Gammaproteobacteria bacterium]|nr:RND family transporter [Gammaproteobacteria bacterium]
MHKFEQAYSRWVMNNRVLIIVATLILVALVGRGAANLEFTNNYRVFFGADNPELLAFEALEKTYSKNDNVLFVITPKDGNVFTPKTLAVIKDLTDKSWQIPFSTRVDSITNYQHTESLQEDDLKVGDLVKDPSALTKADLDKIRNVALNEPILNGRLISDDGETAGVNITINLPGKNLATENPEVVAYARKLADEVKKANPDMEVRLTGMILMNAAFNEASIKDMKSLVLISFLVMLLFLGFLVRSIAPTVATFFVIILSIITALGIGGYIGFPMTPPSASAPTIILTVAIANSVHILVTFLHNMASGTAKNEAMGESLRINLQPVFLASITTAIGFLSMNFSEVPPFRHLGNLVAFGVLASFLLSTTFLPALISFLPVKVRVKKQENDHMMARFGEFVVAR